MRHISLDITLKAFHLIIYSGISIFLSVFSLMTPRRNSRISHAPCLRNSILSKITFRLDNDLTNFLFY